MEKIIAYLRQNYNPKAIILHGSRLREDCPSTSDYDLVLVGSNEHVIVPHRFEDVMLDIGNVAIDTPIIEAGNNVPVWPLQVLFEDEAALGTALSERTHAAYLRGAAPLSAQEWENRKNYMARMLDKLEARGADPAIRRYYLSDIYTRVLRYWFEKRNRWTLTAYLALPVIQKEDAAFHRLMEALWGEDYRDAARKLESLLFNEQA